MTERDTSASSPAGHGRPHVVSPAALLGTVAFLFALTVVTVAVSRLDLGAMNVVAALGIATLKAIAVAAIFMHLRYEGRFHVVVLVGCAIFAALLVGFVVFDTTRYQPDLRAHEAAAARRPAR